MRFFPKTAMGFVVLCMIFSAGVSHASPFTDFVDRQFRQWDRDTSPGCVVHVIHNHETLYQHAYGMANLEFTIPNQVDTVFDIGSNSKQFAVFALLLLEEEGLLSTQDEVSQHIPEFPDFGHIITLDHLIGHTSGLRDYLELMVYAGWNLFEDLITDAQGLQLVERQRNLNFEPGENFIYSNTGFMLIAEIVARVSGMTFPEFVKERIYDPLGMTDSGFRDNHRKIVPRFAAGYSPFPDLGFIRVPMNFASVGAGGMLSTAADLAKWDANFYNPTVGSQAILDKMQTSYKLNNGTPTSYGGGLIMSQYKDKPVVYHGGDLGGYHANIVRFPNDELTIITLANSADLDSNTLLVKSIEIADRFFGAPSTGVANFQLHEPSSQKWGFQGNNFFTPDADFQKFLNHVHSPKPKSQEDSPTLVTPQIIQADAEEFLGKYYSEELESFITLLFDDEENKVLFQFPRTPPYTFSARHIRNDRIFFDQSNELAGSFFRNASGEVAGLRMGNSRVLNLEFRKAEVALKDRF